MRENYRLRTKINIASQYLSKYKIIPIYRDIITNHTIIKFFNRLIHYINENSIDSSNYNYVIIRLSEYGDIVVKFFMKEIIDDFKPMISYLLNSISYSLKGVVIERNKKESILYGFPYIFTLMDGVVYRSNVNSFCQSNPFTRHLIYNTVKSNAKSSTAKKLFCLGGELIYYMTQLEKNFVRMYGCTNCNYIYSDAKCIRPLYNIDLIDYSHFDDLDEMVIIILNVFKITDSMIKFIENNKKFIDKLIVISCNEKEINKIKKLSCCSLINETKLELMSYTTVKESITCFH